MTHTGYFPFRICTNTNYHNNNSSRNILVLLILLITTTATVSASHGDNLYEFQDCLSKCVCSEIPPQMYSVFWSCLSNCNYYCQQSITTQRAQEKLPMVQFYGKWPFRRIMGIQELALVVFSLGNLWVNWTNLKMITRQYKKNSNNNTSTTSLNTSLTTSTTHNSYPNNGKNNKGLGAYTNNHYLGKHEEVRVMYWQYMVLLAVSCMGWIFSMIFHTYDIGVTETLDYIGAFAIILANLNVITVRVFHLNHKKNWSKLLIWQGGLLILYTYHVIRLYMHWDYAYNMQINMIMGFSAMILWIVHSLQVARKYRANFVIYNNSIQLLPYETRILAKLHYLRISKLWLIPYIPIINNCILVCGILLEVNDFEPWWRLVDAHSLWHLLTIFPNLIWFDWNVWDIEMTKLLD